MTPRTHRVTKTTMSSRLANALNIPSIDREYLTLPRRNIRPRCAVFCPSKESLFNVICTPTEGILEPLCITVGSSGEEGCETGKSISLNFGELATVKKRLTVELKKKTNHRSSCPNISLEVLGDAAHRPRICRLARRATPHRCSLLGHIRG